MHNNVSAIISLYCIISYTNKRYNIIEDNILYNIVDVIFSHTDLMKWPCLAVKACQDLKIN